MTSAQKCDCGDSGDAMTSEDSFDGYTKKLARKISSQLNLRPSPVSKLPRPEHLLPGELSAKDTDSHAVQQQLSTALLADYRYDMSHSRRGRALIINNVHFDSETDMPRRMTTGVDIEGLSGVLGEMGFRVQLVVDVTCEQIRRMTSLLSAENHDDSDCFLAVVMTHGDSGVVYGTDGPMSTVDITAPFRGDTCRSLVGKPKLFIFQACRGILVDQGVVKDRRDVDETDTLIGYESAMTIPVEADFLIAYSSPEGYASWRNATTGAWFIQSLVYALRAYGTSWEINRILTLVNRMVALQYESLSGSEFLTRKKQMPCFVSTLTRELFFKPKH